AHADRLRALSGKNQRTRHAKPVRGERAKAATHKRSPRPVKTGRPPARLLATRSTATTPLRVAVCLLITANLQALPLRAAPMGCGLPKLCPKLLHPAITPPP